MAAITSAAIAVAGGAYQAISSAKQAKEAKDALNNLKLPETKNVADGMQVSTLGFDLQKEQSSKRFNSEVDALRSGGIRGVIGGLGSANDRQKEIDRQLMADLDIKQERIDQIRAQDEARIQGVYENRYLNDVSALSSQYNAGQQGMMQGISGAAQGLASGAQMMQSQKNFDKMLNAGMPNAGANAPVISSLNPVGLSGLVRTPSNSMPASSPFSGYSSISQMSPAGLTYSNIPTANFKIRQ